MSAYATKGRTPSVGVPPHDLEAEKSVLGALLLDKDAIVKIVETLRPSHFYKSSHEKIYEAMLTLYEKREPIDLITVPAELKSIGELESSGGVTYLTELVNAVPTAANVEFYSRMVSEDYVK